MNLDDTIVAVATPAGRGGIGVVRLAGPQALRIAAPMLRLRHELEAGRAVFGELIDPCGADTPVRLPEGATEAASLDGGTAARSASPGLSPTGVSDPQRIDEVVVTYFAKPHSYTTNDIIEISAHGSPVVLRHIMELCVAAGARLAEPGEFTMRAFLNGRIDLTQAEAVRDLIDSQTLYQAKVAAQQLDGALSRRLQPIKQNLVELIAILEAGIDFAEDDVSVLPNPQILDRINSVRAPLDHLAASFAYGKIVHEGLTLAIVGRPNVGKSSLFNRLVESERAIVTATPGTTRDLVTETVAIEGIPVKLVDTAGIRAAVDEAESIGIRKSMEALADADLVLVVTDASQPQTNEDDDLIAQASQRPAILVENKCDLDPAARIAVRASAEAPSLPAPEGLPNIALRLSAGTTPAETRVPEGRLNHIHTSALTGEGIPELRKQILRHVAGESGSQAESGFLTNIRHAGLIHDSLAAIDAAEAAVAAKVPHEMLLMDIYNVLRPLDAITGATTTDDILNLIFSTFCIGK